MAERETGKVKWFNDAKGYGFIERPQGEDLFVHFSSVRGTGFKKLTEGQNVDFVVGQSDRGAQAQDVGPAVSEIPQRLRDLEAESVAATDPTPTEAPTAVAEAEPASEEEEAAGEEQRAQGLAEETSADSDQVDEESPSVAVAQASETAEEERPAESGGGESPDNAEARQEPALADEDLANMETEEASPASP